MKINKLSRAVTSAYWGNAKPSRQNGVCTAICLSACLATSPWTMTTAATAGLILILKDGKPRQEVDLVADQCLSMGK